LYSIDKNLDEETETIFLQCPIKKLDNVDKNKCEGLLTEYKCKLALSEMNNNKSPGSDGITVEFYKHFWDIIKKYYINSINFSCLTGELNTLQKQGLIFLIPKPNKDLENLNNWRPISLLNVDYKIATKAIANRLKSVLPSIIDNEQSGFLKDRYIGENVKLILEVIDYLNTYNKPGLLFFADFEKAFDSISHKFMLNSLQTLNFGPDIIQWTKVFLYRHPKHYN